MMNRSKIKSILIGILITLYCTAFSQNGAGGGGSTTGGGGSTGGGGGISGWVISYSCSGSCIYHGWQINNLPSGGQTATPVTIDRMAMFAQPFSTPTFNAAGAGASYTPPGANLPTILTSSLDLNLKVKTTYTWTGSAPAPTEVKVAITGNSFSQALYGEGAASADDGLGIRKLEERLLTVRTGP
ncbi:MAG: hypothetical protein WCI55_14915 [Armatimonadota bacterium]